MGAGHGGKKLTIDWQRDSYGRYNCERSDGQLIGRVIRWCSCRYIGPPARWVAEMYYSKGTKACKTVIEAKKTVEKQRGWRS